MKLSENRCYANQYAPLSPLPEGPEDIRAVERRDGDENKLHGPVDYVKKLELSFRLGYLDLPER